MQLISDSIQKPLILLVFFKERLYRRNQYNTFMGWSILEIF